MFRTILFTGLLCLGACSSQPQPAPHGTAATPSPQRAAPSADALAAKRAVQTYFDQLRARDYRKAWQSWSAAAAGDVEAFVAASKAKGRFDGHAGDPTDVRDSGGVRYVLVESTARVTSPNGKISDQTGVVMLRRPARGGEPWRIWGVDIRPLHCPKGQVARGLGCLKP